MSRSLTTSTTYTRQQDNTMSSEMADLHIRSTSLAAENEALRGHVQHLQDKIARLEDTITEQELAAANSASLESAQMHAEVERQRSLLREVSAAAHDLESENESLTFEVAGLRDAKRLVDIELTTLKERTKTLQELYLRATRTGQGTPAASTADMRLDVVDDIIRSAMPPCSADPCLSGEDFAEPASIVQALQQIAALRRERDVLRAQVKKTEGALEQALREKQDLSHALATEKHRASGKNSQARLINLARRVQILAEQVRQKDAALSEKAAYVAKLEWRLLCQQKAVEGRQKKPPLACPKVPAANRALHRKPHLPGSDLASSRIPPVDPPKQSAVNAVHRSPVEGRDTKQPHTDAGVSADVAAQYGGFPASSGVHEDVGSNMHGSNAPAAMQHDGMASRASRSSKPSARKSLFSTPEPARDREPSSSPGHRRRNPMPTPQQAPTPTYISRSQQQESGLNAGVVESRPAAVQASPAISEMVYELRPAGSHGQQPHVPHQDDLEGHGGSNASRLPPDPAAAVSRWEHVEAGMPHGQTAGSGDHAALVPGGEMANHERAAFVMGLASWHHRGIGFAVKAGQWGSPEGVASSLPNYSGFSSEMRAAAQATAAALLADASWPGESAAPHGATWQAESATPHEQLSTAKQLRSAGHEEYDHHGQGEADWGARAAEAVQGHVSQDRGRGHILTVEELEEQIRAFNLMLEADEGGVLLEQGEGSVVADQSSSALSQRRKSQQNLGAWCGLASPTKV